MVFEEEREPIFRRKIDDEDLGGVVEEAGVGGEASHFLP